MKNLIDRCQCRGGDGTCSSCRDADREVRWADAMCRVLGINIDADDDTCAHGLPRVGGWACREDNCVQTRLAVEAAENRGA
jgi:hypothetical protein